MITGIFVISEKQAQTVVSQWLEAWNAHDLEMILSHYSDDITLVSPIAERLVESSSGQITGKKELASYFKLGLKQYPDLHFKLHNIMLGLNSLVIHYTKATRNQ
jgi:hypothetical protein